MADVVVAGAMSMRNLLSLNLIDCMELAAGHERLPLVCKEGTALRHTHPWRAGTNTTLCVNDDEGMPGSALGHVLQEWCHVYLICIPAGSGSASPGRALQGQP